MSEFSFIHQLKSLSDQKLGLNLEDDAALMPNSDVICTDTLVEGVHFIGDEPPKTLAHKLLAVNVSDVYSMNARPTHALLNLSLPLRCGEGWRSAFVRGLEDALKRFGMQLLGGDTTSSPGSLVMSATVLGTLENRTAWTRSAAQVGDLVCVSGPIGRGVLGLADVRNGETQTQHAEHYRQPMPSDLMLDALGVGACADVSDGLIADLGHIAKASKVSVVMDLKQVPYADPLADWAAQLTGGDDYVLVFTLSPRSVLPKDCSVIGWVQDASKGNPVILRGPDAIVAKALARSGYIHF